MTPEQIRDLAEAGQFQTLIQLWGEVSPGGDHRRHELSVALRLRLIEWAIGRSVERARVIGILAKRGDIYGPSLNSFGIERGWVNNIRRDIPPTTPFDVLLSTLDELSVEGEGSRAAVRRKLLNETPVSDRPEHLHGTHRMRPERVVQSTVETLRGLCDGIEMLDSTDYDSLTPENVSHWAAEIYECRRIIGKLHKELTTRA